MNTQIACPHPTAPAPEDCRSEVSAASGPALDTLVDLEFRIARRADEISAALPPASGMNLYCWLKAEQEIFTAANFPDRPPAGLR
jgi:hypothetical protein